MQLPRAPGSWAFSNNFTNCGSFEGAVFFTTAGDAPA
jgi:hypothetical protein